MNIWQKSKDVPVSCLNIIKFYKNNMDGVDIMDQKTATYRIDRKSKYRFYLSMFVDFMDVTHVNSHIAYMKLVDDISLLNFKIVVAKALIVDTVIAIDRSSLLGQTSESLMNHPWSEKSQPVCLSSSRNEWDYCKDKSSDLKSFVSWPVLMLDERNRFLKHHL